MKPGAQVILPSITWNEKLEYIKNSLGLIHQSSVDVSNHGERKPKCERENKDNCTFGRCHINVTSYLSFTKENTDHVLNYLSAGILLRKWCEPPTKPEIK